MSFQDTAGSERYQSMSRIYYRGAKAAIVCYDLTDKTSYEKAQFWVDELLKCGEEVRTYLLLLLCFESYVYATYTFDVQDVLIILNFRYTFVSMVCCYFITVL